MGAWDVRTKTLCHENVECRRLPPTPFEESYCAMSLLFIAEDEWIDLKGAARSKERLNWWK